MRTLKKSSCPCGCGVAQYMRMLRPTNTSTKPHARLMHALNVLKFGENLHTSSTFGPIPMEPSRAARRSFKVGPKLANNYSKPNPNWVNAPEPKERKLTGAVRRGLERGRVA